MKKILPILPAILSYLLIAAHFLRRGEIVCVILAIIFPFILIIKKKISLIIVKLGLLIIIFIWCETFFNLMKFYNTYHISFLKPAIILISVILFTIFALLLLNIKSFKNTYQ